MPKSSPAACRFANDQDGAREARQADSYWLQSWDPYRIPVAGGPGAILGLRAWRLVPKGGIFYALTATVPWTDDRIRFDAALLMESPAPASGRIMAWRAVAVAVAVPRGAPQLYRLVPSPAARLFLCSLPAHPSSS